MNEEHFQNLAIDINYLPKIKEVDFYPIQRDYLKVSLISNLIFFLVLSTATFLILFYADNSPEIGYYIAGGVLITLISTSLFLTIIGIKRKKYALRDKDIIYTKGVIWSVRTTIPFNRIQHAEIKQGPLERMFKLSSLKVYTAGGQSSDLVIPGLSNEKAQQLKDFILGKTAEDGK